MGFPEELARVSLLSSAASPFWKRATAGVLSFALVVTVCILSIELEPQGLDAAVKPLTPHVVLSQRQVAAHLSLEPSVFQPSTGSPFRAAPVCWPRDDVAPRERPLEVSGPWCSVCLAGKLCTFTVYLRPPANWTGPGTGAFEWDLMVTLVGPAMVHGYTNPSPTTDVNDTFVVAYRTFEPGEYRVSLATNCVSLSGVPKLGGYPGRGGIQEVATWNVTVLPAPLEEGPISPCQVSHTQGRWLRQDGAPADSKFEVGPHYEWEFFRCAGATPVTEALARLASRGFFDLAFYGDSHIRQLLFHSMYLILNFTDPKGEKAHKGLNYNFTVPVPDHLRSAVLQAAKAREKLLGPSHAGAATTATREGAPLFVTVRLNFYWVDGVYQNNEYGCKMRGVYSDKADRFPDFPNTTDVIITDTGVWTAGYCSQPLSAYSKHLTDFYDHVRARMQPEARLVTFGTIPSSNCVRLRPYNTNSMKAYMNNLARTLGQNYGAHNFDLWDVVAPRFALPCLQRGDGNHYSCYTEDKKGMQGLVGKGLSLAMLHFLNHLL